jgi:acyl-coenzyme A synthetase/AMP-(fatty) acid ligase
LKVKNFYGTSETGAISFDASEAPRSAPGYVGKPLPGIKASRDASGRIVVESDSTAIATDAEAWPAEFGSGAYRTLDQGEVTQAGIFVSRCVGNAINVAGRKVSPTRLEAIFETLDGVLGVKVERSQSRDFERFEEIRVQLTVEKNFDKIAIREQFRQRIESWEMPRHWEFVEG